MSVTLNYAFKLFSLETLSNVDGASNPIVIHDSFDETGVLNGDSTIPVTKILNKILTLTAGAFTLDLTTELTTAGVALAATGLKVRAIRIKPLGANNIVMATGASNGYTILPTDKTIYTGGIWQELFGDALGAIGSGAKTLDFTGTGSQTFRITILVG